MKYRYHKQSFWNLARVIFKGPSEADVMITINSQADLFC